jgi:hypothetical protein
MTNTIKEILFFAIPIGGVVLLLALIGAFVYFFARRSRKK